MSRILILHTGALGDTVLAARIAQAFRFASPAAKITFACRDEWLELLKRCAAVDEACGLDHVGIYRLHAGRTPNDLAEMLTGFDLIITGISGEHDTLTAQLRSAAAGMVIAYDPQPDRSCNCHICRQWLNQIISKLERLDPGWARQLAHAANGIISRPAAIFASAEPQKADCLQLLAGISRDIGKACLEKRLVIIHPGSGSLKKCWPAENFCSVADVLTSRGLQPLFVFGPAEVERLPQQIRMVRSRWPCLILPNLEVLLAATCMCSMFIGNDSGPTHLAAAAGARTCAIFGPTDPAVWAPLGQSVITVRSHLQDWSDLPVRRLIEAVSEFLEP